MGDAYREKEREITFENVITKATNDKDDCFGSKPNFDTISSRRYHHFRDRDSFEFFTTSGCKHRRQIDLLSELQVTSCLLYECRERVIISDIVGRKRDLDI